MRAFSKDFMLFRGLLESLSRLILTLAIIFYFCSGCRGLIFVLVRIRLIPTLLAAVSLLTFVICVSFKFIMFVFASPNNFWLTASSIKRCSRPGCLCYDALIFVWFNWICWPRLSILVQLNWIKFFINILWQSRKFGGLIFQVGDFANF